tara:strand:+ start:2915 stop:3181 length:267 start_codon:yes stop_codon:yes gene_type:complete
MQTVNKVEYYSLYEYLGKAAGKELGREVNAASRRSKQPIVKQYVEQGGYKGEVFCYTKRFLDDYFYVIENWKHSYNKYPEPEDDDLPF